MKQSLLLTVFFVPALSAFSQTSADYAVQAWATTETSPPKITLHWLDIPDTVNVEVYRKTKTSNTWTQYLGSVPGTDTSYSDATISVGTEYEYRLIKTGAPVAYGYVLAGVEVPQVDYRGTILLVIDTTHLAQLQAEIDRLRLDMVGDGWAVKTLLVDASDAVASVKALIAAAATDPDVKSVFLLGHVPVPYSGNTYPDGHPDHQGAWPADVFYGDINGSWSDNAVNITVASQPRNHNIPGDGKYDQTVIPSDIDLQVGRVDMFDLPTFSFSEVELLRRYLDKNHSFRQKEFTADPRALVDDNFGAFGGEAFGSNAWRNFGPLLGPTTIVTTDYRTTLNSDSYIWSYGCGGGSYTSCGGIGNSSDFAWDSLKTIFTMLFGSYFGDWDSQNNFLRSALAQGQTLTNCWAGRPYWQFHQMALGENVGYCARRSQNSSLNTPYYTAISFMQRNIHMALMGDPTLRMHIIAPPRNVVANISANQTTLTWSPSADTVLGYHIFRSTEPFGRYERITGGIIDDTSFVDECVVSADTFYYMVRAIRLETSPSGSYYNMSQGAFGSIINPNDISVWADFSVNASQGTVSLTNQSTNATIFWWDFGDGNTSTDANPVHEYMADGDYTVTLTASSDCDTDTTTQVVTITGVGMQVADEPRVTITPNPAHGVIIIERRESTPAELIILSPDGRVVLAQTLRTSRDQIALPYSLPSGAYTVRVISAASGEESSCTLIVQ